MTTTTVQAHAPNTLISANGFKVGDQVVWTDSDNACRWGRCYGVVTMGTEDYNLGQLAVFWHKACNRHNLTKHTESDAITRPHVKVTMLLP